MASSFAVTDFVKIIVNKQAYMNRSTPKAALPIVAALAAIALLASALTIHAQSPAPAKPTGLTAESAGYETLTLVWDDLLDSSITGYQILRRFRDGSKYGDEKGSPQFEVIEENIESAATRYVDRSIKPHTRYVYRVKARNANGLSERSTALEAETPKLPEVSQSDRLKDRIATILASPIIGPVGGIAGLIGSLIVLGALIWLVGALIQKESMRLPVMFGLCGLAVLVLSSMLWMVHELRSKSDAIASSTYTNPTAETRAVDRTVMRDYLDAAQRAIKDTSSQDTDLDSIAYSMAIISGSGTPNPADFDHFRHWLSSFTVLCPDLSTHVESANNAVSAQLVMEQEGVVESLRDVSDSVHFIVMDLHKISASLFQIPNVCSDMFTLYATMRLAGTPPGEARENLVALTKALAFPQ